MTKQQYWSDLDRNTVFHRTPHSKNTAALCMAVAEVVLILVASALKAVHPLETCENRTELIENTHAFFGKWAKLDSSRGFVGFDGGSNNEFEPVSEFLHFLDPSETSAASVGIVVCQFGSVDGFVFYTV